MKLANMLLNTNTLLARRWLPYGQMDSDSVFVLLTVAIYHLKGPNHHQLITCDWGSANFHKQINRNCRQDNIFDTRHFLVSVLAKLEALKYEILFPEAKLLNNRQWVPRLIKQCRIGLYIWCIEAFIVFFFM